MPKPPKPPPKNVLKLIKKHTKPLPMMPNPLLPGVISTESLWSRFRRRRGN